MADSSELKAWLLNNNTLLSLKATRLTWVKDWLPGFSDFSVEISINGKKHVGRGIAPGDNLAFVKAGAEAVERATCSELGIRSNGVATHTDGREAQANAKLELIERDRLLRHYLLSLPLSEIPRLDTGRLNIEIIRTKLQRSEMSFRLFRLNPTTDVEVALALVMDERSPRRFGSFVGAGASHHIEGALEKASIEALSRAVGWLVGNRPRSLSLEQFREIGEAGPKEHMTLHLTPESADAWANLLNARGNLTQDAISLADIACEKIQSGVAMLRHAPLYTFRAQSRVVLPMFYGSLEKSETFSLIQSTFPNVSVHRFPHPMA